MPKISSDASGGLQIRRAEHQVGPGSFLELADADLEASGSVGVRSGYREVVEPDGGTEKGEALFYRGEELAILRDAALWSYSDSVEIWSERGPCWIGRLRETGLARDLTNQRYAAMDEQGPYLSALWTVGVGTDEPIYWQVYDHESLSAITARVPVDDGALPVVVAAKTWVALAWFVFNPAGAPILDDRIELAYWDPGDAAPTTTGAWPVGAGTTNDLRRRFAMRHSGNDTVAIATKGNGALEIQVQEFQRGTSLQLVTQAGGTSTVDARYVELVRTELNAHADWALIWIDGLNTIFVRWLDGSFAFLAEASILATWSDDGIAPVAVETCDGDVAITYSTRAAPFLNFGGGVEYFLSTYDGVTAGLTSQGTQLGVVASSRPVVVRDRVVQPLVMEDNTQIIVGTTTPRSSFSSAFVVHDVAQQAVIARSSDTGRALDLQMLGAPVETVQIDETVRWLGVYVVRPELPTYSGDQGRLAIHDLDLRRCSHAAAVVQSIAHLAGGGFAWLYDGTTASELDFHTKPAVTFEDLANSPPTPLGPGTYSWAFQYEWEDAQGNLYRSAPKIYTFTLAGGAAPSFQVISYHQTARSNVRLLVSRTRETATNDPTFYRVDDTTTLAPPDVQTITFVDVTDDATAITNEVVLPTATLQQGAGGSELQHFPTPCTDFIVFALGRLWCGDPRLANAVRFSLPQVSGDGMAFSPLQAVQLATDGRATAATQQDRTMFGFTAAQVHYWQGRGPNRDGTGQQFSEPSRTPAEFGASDQNCVVLTPAGICYVGFDGPVLLARDRASANAIEAVEEAYRYLGQECVAAVYEPRMGAVRFYDAGPDVEMEGPRWKRLTLRWHVPSGRWCHDTRHQAVDGDISPEGKSAFLRTDGMVCLHDRHRYTDGLKPVELYGVTPWLRMGGLTPEQQVNWLDLVGQWLSRHKLELDLRKNYNWDAGAGDALFEPTLVIDPEREGLRDEPLRWQDGQGSSYVFRWQTSGVRAYALSVAFRVVHDGTGPAAAIVAMELDTEPLSDNPAPMDPRRVF